MHELMFQAGVKGMSERSELIPCIYIIIICMAIAMEAKKASLPHPRPAFCTTLWVAAEKLDHYFVKHAVNQYPHNIIAQL